MTVSLSKRLLGIVDKARKVNRAQFIRDAIQEKLESMGIPLPEQVLAVPDRVKKHFVDHTAVTLNVTLNEEPGQTVTTPAARTVYPTKKQAKKKGKKS